MECFTDSQFPFPAQVLSLPPASLLRHITPLLMGDNDEAIVEAARLYGNLSLQPQVGAQLMLGTA